MHVRRISALGLVVLLVLGGASAPIAAVGAPSPATVADDANQPTDRSPTRTQAGNGTLSTLDAMELVQNQTNGTVIGVRRGTQGRNGTVETLSYVVFVLQGNESEENRSQVDQQLLGVTVDAGNGTIVSTEPRTSSDEIAQQDVQILPSQSINLSTTRSAVKATRIGVNQSANVTVESVTLQLTENNTSTLAYAINVENADGSRVTILVAARKGQGGIISVERNDG